MRKLLAILALLCALGGAARAAWATTPLPIYCDAATITPCSSTTQVGSGSQGDIWWKAFGKVNDIGDQLGLFATQPANEVLGTGPGGGYPALESLSAAKIVAFIGTPAATHCAEWSSSGMLEDSGGACGGGGGTPGGTNGQLQYNNSGAFGGFTVTSFDLLCGGGTAVPSMIAPSATSGYPLISQGSSACPAFGQLPVSAIAASGTPSSSTWLRGDGVWGTPTGSGTVTNFSFTNANGFSGSVTNPTTTPILSLSVTGPLQLYTTTTASVGTCNSGTAGYIQAVKDGGVAALATCNGTNWVSDGTTAFTAAGSAGCTISTTAGDASGGYFIVGTGCTPGTATVTITFNGSVGMTATHLWVCTIYDFTLQSAGSWFGDWAPSAHTTTTVTIPIPLAASIGDEIDFACSAH